MWCRSCQQDVPGVASPDSSAVRCARCHSPGLPSEAAIEAESDAERNSEPDAQEGSDVEAEPVLHVGFPARFEDWELDDDIHASERKSRHLGLTPSLLQKGRGSTPGEGWEEPVERRARSRPGRRRIRGRQQSALIAFLTWTLLSIGLMSFVFGGVLLGWSFFQSRADLWRFGMPFAIAGQAAMILGLVFQLEGLWRSNRTANDTLCQLDEQLTELRHATKLLTTTHSDSARSFYIHMAEGASPHLLLADLKGQLDMLATKLSDEA